MQKHENKGIPMRVKMKSHLYLTLYIIHQLSSYEKRKKDQTYGRNDKQKTAAYKVFNPVYYTPAYIYRD